MIRPCFACGSQEKCGEYHIREMMFGTEEEFLYDHCASCLSLQIRAVPEDLSRYYTVDSYYSLQTDLTKSRSQRTPLRRFLSSMKNRAILHGWLPLPGHPPQQLAWLHRAGIKPESRILDVGCGNGAFLLSLQEMGLNNLMGIDPHLQEDETCQGGVTLCRASISDIEGQFDCITFHHVIEHVEDPKETIREAQKRLRPNGVILLRTPLMMCKAWEIYKEHWAQLDAPRHLHIFSKKGLEILLENLGLVAYGWEYDSTAFQFWASELYRQGISLYDQRSPYGQDTTSIFSKNEFQQFEKRAALLNGAGEGDQVCVFTRHRDTGGVG